MVVKQNGGRHGTLSEAPGCGFSFPPLCQVKFAFIAKIDIFIMN